MLLKPATVASRIGPCSPPVSIVLFRGQLEVGSDPELEIAGLSRQTDSALRHAVRDQQGRSDKLAPDWVRKGHCEIVRIAVQSRGRGVCQWRLP